MKTKTNEFELVFSKENAKHVSKELIRYLISELKQDNVEYDFKIDPRTGIMKPELNPDGSFKANSTIRMDIPKHGLLRNVINALCIEEENLPENSMELFNNFNESLKKDIEDFSIVLREKLNDIITGDKEQLINSIKINLIEFSDIPHNPYTLKITRNSASKYPSSKEEIDFLINSFFSEDNDNTDTVSFLRNFKEQNKDKYKDIMEITKTRSFYELNIDMYIDYSSSHKLI